jgi:hypothetical protein
MKITDDQLLRLFWVAQLNKLASGVLSNYVGGRSAVNDAKGSDFEYASSLCRGSAAKITSEIGRNQILARMTRLVASKKLEGRFYGSCLGSFWISSDIAIEAFLAARQWWLIRGVPTGFCTEKQGMRTVLVPELKRMKDECQEYLVNEFGRVKLNDLFKLTKAVDYNTELAA